MARGGRTAIVVIIAGGLLAGCAGTTAMVPKSEVSAARSAASDVAAGRCPATEPLYVANSGSGLRSSLVPRAASRMVVCRYDGTDATPPLARHGSTVVTGAATVREWRRRFNALPALPQGRFNCPDDTQSGVVVAFTGVAHPVAVRVATSGCGWVSNGASMRAGRPALTNDLLALVP